MAAVVHVRDVGVVTKESRYQKRLDADKDVNRVHW